VHRRRRRSDRGRISVQNGDERHSRGHSLRRLLAAAAVLIVAAGALTGCAGAPIPPTYTQQELKSNCERQNGCWHEDDLRGGFCEYKS